MMEKGLEMVSGSCPDFGIGTPAYVLTLRVPEIVEKWVPGRCSKAQGPGRLICG